MLLNNHLLSLKVRTMFSSAGTVQWFRSLCIFFFVYSIYFMIATELSS